MSLMMSSVGASQSDDGDNVFSSMENYYQDELFFLSPELEHTMSQKLQECLVLNDVFESVGERRHRLEVRREILAFSVHVVR